MAVCLVGFRHCGIISQGNGKQKISPGRHRLFYEVVEAEPLANIRDVDAKKFI